MGVVEIREEITDYMNHTDDESFLQMIRQMINYHQASREKLRPMTMEELNTRIDEAEEDIKEGRVYSTEEMRAYFAKKQA